ncbi:MAG: rhodanese-like domain-containing protein [Flavobacterium sp.]
MEAKTAMDMVKEAKSGIENLTPDEVQTELSKGNATLIDIRESEELKQNGKIADSIHAPRGMLEFYAEASYPTTNRNLTRITELLSTAPPEVVLL